MFCIWLSAQFLKHQSLLLFLNKSILLVDATFSSIFFRGKFFYPIGFHICRGWLVHVISISKYTWILKIWVGLLFSASRCCFHATELLRGFVVHQWTDSVEIYSLFAAIDAPLLCMLTDCKTDKNLNHLIEQRLKHHLFMFLFCFKTRTCYPSKYCWKYGGWWIKV